MNQNPANGENTSQNDKKYLELGKIVSVHGLKGEVRVENWSSSPDFILQFKTVYIGDKKTPIKVETARAQKGMAVMKLCGYDDIDTANTLRGKLIYMDKTSVKLPERTYFVQDLLGLEVIDAQNEGVSYGRLVEVSATGANDVYHIEKNGKLYLIPAIKQVVIETDLEHGVMKITPLEGLFDDED